MGRLLGDYLDKQNIKSAFYTAQEKCVYDKDASNTHDMLKHHGKRLDRDIYWLNNPYFGSKKLSIEADIFYGNNPTAHEEIYKSCVLLTYLPSYEKRKKTGCFFGHILSYKGCG